jgi:enamine deaminase RidA (YjgF/YER057c/UK114 family)
MDRRAFVGAFALAVAAHPRATLGQPARKVTRIGVFVQQTRVILGKFQRLLEAAGGGMEHIVQTTEYITTTDQYRRTAEVRREFFRPPYPTATGVIVAGLLREGAVIEISAVAVLPG